MALFNFFVDELHSLVKATSVFADIDDIVNLKFSRETFAMMVESPIFPSSIIALHLGRSFFREYFCQQLQYSWIYLTNIYPEMLELEESGFTSLDFSFADPHRADLTYEYQHGSWEVSFPLHEMDGSRDVNRFDSATFVSVESQQFINIVTECDDHDHVYVSITSSQIKFLCPPTIQIILTHESRRCVIGGVREGIEVSFVVTLHPTEAFCNLARQSERVWMFKASGSADGIIYAPIGLHAQFLAYPSYMKIQQYSAHEARSVSTAGSST